MSMREREHLVRHTAEKLQGAILQPWEKTITAAQMLALFTTPIALVEAPGPNKIVIPQSVVVEKPVGTAFTLGTAGPLNIGHGTDPATNILINIILAGFMDAATKQGRIGFFPSPTDAVGNAVFAHINNATRRDNLGLYLRQATANMTAGDTPLRVHVYGYVLPVDLTFSW